MNAVLYDYGCQSIKKPVDKVATKPGVINHLVDENRIYSG
jgi:hypothetical protein